MATSCCWGALLLADGRSHGQTWCSKHALLTSTCPPGATHLLPNQIGFAQLLIYGKESAVKALWNNNCSPMFKTSWPPLKQPCICSRTVHVSKGSFLLLAKFWMAQNIPSNEEGAIFHPDNVPCHYNNVLATPYVSTYAEGLSYRLEINTSLYQSSVFVAT